MMPKSTAFARSVMLALFILCTSACGDSPSGPTSPIGFYALSSVDADPVPSTLFQGEGYLLEVASGTLELEADFSFVAEFITRETVDLAVSIYVDSLRGSWSQAASGQLQFTPEDYEMFSGLWQGQKVIFSLDTEFVMGALIFARVP